VCHIFSLLFFITTHLCGGDTASWINLDGSFDHLVIEGEDLEFIELDEFNSIDQLTNIDFINGKHWDSIQYDINDYNSLVKLHFANTSTVESDWWLNIPGNYYLYR